MSDKYKQVVGAVEGLECTYDGKFRYNGKEKTVLFCHTVTGRKATARIMIMINKKTHYWQAAKLVAKTWKVGYNDDDSYITYNDGDCHNISADNLTICNHKVMAWVGLQGSDERVSVSPRLKCELEHLQELYHIKGGEVPNSDFVELIQQYTKELKDYTDNHDGEFPEWLNKLIEERYGFKPYKL